jgi:hypothetical protein
MDSKSYINDMSMARHRPDAADETEGPVRRIVSGGTIEGLGGFAKHTATLVWRLRETRRDRLVFSMIWKIV